MATFTVPANTQIDSDATFGPLGVGDLEQVFGTAINTTINGGEQDVELNGIANLTTINPFGFQEVLLGGFAEKTTIQGGEQDVEGGGVANFTTINGGFQEVFSSAGNTIINGGGVQDVFNTAVVNGTNINIFGEQIIHGGGTAINTTINQGGQQILVSTEIIGGGTANLTTIDGGTQTILAGTAMNTTINSGEQDVVPFVVGTAENTQIIGGFQVVGSNGIADNTTIEGGTMHVMAGGVTNGTITFAGGLLVIDQPVSGSTSFATPLVGVQALVDSIDLTGLPFSTGATAVLSPDRSQLTVTSGNNSETFTLQNLDPSVTGFETAPENPADPTHSGTEVMAVELSTITKAVAPVVWNNLPRGFDIALKPDGNVHIVSIVPASGTTVTDANGLPNINIVGWDIAMRNVASSVSDPIGGASNTLNGADSGKDTFVFFGSFGPNTINNFITRDEGNHDTLELSRAEFGDLATMIKNGNIQQVGPDTLITNPLNPADIVKLAGISASELQSHPSNFVFV